MRAFVLTKGNVTSLDSEDAGVAPLPPRCRNFLDRVNTSVVTTNVYCRSIKHERPSLQQMAKLLILPGVVHWGREWYIGRFLFSLFVNFVLCLAHAFVCSMFPVFLT